jgi:hypothetical protein
MALKTRHIVIELVLDKQQFPNSGGSNTKIIRANSDNSSLTVKATINKSVGQMNSSANVSIMGMLNEDIDVLDKLIYNQGVPLYKDNKVLIYAGYTLDDNNYPPLTYVGDIYLGGVDRNNPNRPFIIQSIVGYYSDNVLLKPISVKGSIPLTNLFSNIVSNAGEDFIYTPNNVTGFAENIAIYGNFKHQMTMSTRPNGYKWMQDDKYILVAPVNSEFRLTPDPILINYQTGLLGYPVTASMGIQCRTYYNPQVTYGSLIDLESNTQFVNENGELQKRWYVNGLNIELENRGSLWESTLSLNNVLYTTGALA